MYNAHAEMLLVDARGGGRKKSNLLLYYSVPLVLFKIITYIPYLYVYNMGYYTVPIFGLCDVTRFIYWYIKYYVILFRGGFCLFRPSYMYGGNLVKKKKKGSFKMCLFFQIKYRDLKTA